MRKTKIGQLDERIEFETRQTGTDAIGGKSEVFITSGSAWCKVIKANKTGNDHKENAGNMTGIREVEFIIRYRTDLNESMVIKYEDELGIKYYKIESINEISEDRRKSFLSIKGTKYDINK